MTLAYEFNIFTGTFDLVDKASTSAAIARADISSQFDSVTTTFTIPSYSSILSFNITGWFPNGELANSDFTTPTNTTVSLVVPPLSAPASGTTGIILYVPA